MDPIYRQESVSTLGPNKKHCYVCASILDARAELCPKCGVRQPVIGAMVPATPMQLVPRTTKSKSTAGIFALLLGGIGIHKFYLGQTGLGVVYLLFCWTMIPALIAFIEGIILLTMSDEAFAQKYPG